MSEKMKQRIEGLIELITNPAFTRQGDPICHNDEINEEAVEEHCNAMRYVIDNEGTPEKLRACLYERIKMYDNYQQGEIKDLTDRDLFLILLELGQRGVS